MNRLEIINKAFLKLGQSPVPSLEDTDDRTQCALAIYESVRNTEQTSYRWSFCTKRFILNAMTVTDDDNNPVIVKPAFGYTYQYLLPKGFLRLIEIHGHRQMDYAIEGDRLLTNLEGPLNIIALCLEENEHKFPPAFVEAFATRLAIELCTRIKQDSTSKAQLQQEYLYNLSMAKKTDAIQRATMSTPDGSWIDIRMSEIGSTGF